MGMYFRFRLCTATTSSTGSPPKSTSLASRIAPIDSSSPTEIIFTIRRYTLLMLFRICIWWSTNVMSRIFVKWTSLTYFLRWCQELLMTWTIQATTICMRLSVDLSWPFCITTWVCWKAIMQPASSSSLITPSTIATYCRIWQSKVETRVAN